MAVDWSAYSSWDLVLPPNRPGEELLQSISLVLSTTAKVTSVCILGSTPEYRLLCAKLAIPDVTIIDKSETFSVQCDNYTIPNLHENKIYGDWLDVLPQCGNSYDIVLSHFTHGNVHFNQRAEFFKMVRQSLRPGGLFIDFVLHPLSPGYDLSTIESRFQNRPANIRTYNDFNCIALFQSEMIGKMGCVDTTAIYSFLDSSLTSDAVRMIAAGTKKITPPGYIWYYAFDKPPSIFNFFEGYQVLATLPEPANSPFFGAAVLYVLKK